ncbi:MAG TPA: hypothetical protein VMF03_09955 [Steroidobacteraceae bacterium]|nr:hypothetical protein [Steroidobacteraceae bacterium]
MNASDGEPSQSTLLQSGLEVRSRLVLEEGLSRIDARTRSRLNQARQAAVAAAARPSALTWLYRLLTRNALMPAGAAAAAALIAVLMLSSGQRPAQPVAENPAATLDVLDLVTDDDAMKLMEDNDSSFYEWAAAQADAPAGGATT